jgi:hypothetical protein
MKTIKIITLAILLLLISACGTKKPFEVQKPLKSAALVYVYVLSDTESSFSNSVSKYDIRINNKKVSQNVSEAEYMALDLQPKSIKLSATKGQIEEQNLHLNLKAGETYYLKIVDKIEGTKFEFYEVSSATGEKEIAKTTLAGSSIESKEYVVDAYIKESKLERSEEKQNISKIDEIQKAYNLKEKGILTDEEFQSLKSEILSK